MTGTLALAVALCDRLASRQPISLVVEFQSHGAPDKTLLAKLKLDAAGPLVNWTTRGAAFLIENAS